MAKQTQIEIFTGHLGEGWYWRCRHRNGHIVCDGSEAYSNKSNAKRAARRIAGTLSLAPIVEI